MIGDHAVVGADMVTMVLPLPRERRLDWDAAAAAIRDVRLEVLWDTGELYPWEYWLGEVENLPGAVPALVALRAAQGELHGYACELRGAIEHGWPDELIALETPTHTVWVTGGPSWGEPPGDLVDATIYLAEAGITNAAGFDGYTRYDGPPIEQRSASATTSCASSASASPPLTPPSRRPVWSTRNSGPLAQSGSMHGGASSGTATTQPLPRVRR